jgi:hypothetical protein
LITNLQLRCLARQLFNIWSVRIRKFKAVNKSASFSLSLSFLIPHLFHPPSYSGRHSIGALWGKQAAGKKGAHLGPPEATYITGTERDRERDRERERKGER